MGRTSTTARQRSGARGLIAGVMLTVSAAPVPGKTLTVAVSRTPLSAPFYVARANGHFDAAGIDVAFVERVGGHRALRAMLDGEADLATVSGIPIMLTSFERSDFAVTATFVNSEDDVKIVARGDRGLESAADLAGRRIGTVTGASSHFFLDLFLLFHDVDPASVEVVHVAPDEAADALADGRVDAVAVWEPFAMLAAQRLGPAARVLGAPGLYRETFNLVCRNDAVKGRGAEVVALLGALAAAIVDIRRDAAAARATVAGALRIDPVLLERMWPVFEYRLTLDRALVVTLESEANWALANGRVRGAIPNYLDFLSPAALSAIDPAAVRVLH